MKTESSSRVSTPTFVTVCAILCLQAEGHTFDQAWGKLIGTALITWYPPPPIPPRAS